MHNFSCFAVAPSLVPISHPVPVRSRRSRLEGADPARAKKVGVSPGFLGVTTDSLLGTFVGEYFFQSTFGWPIFIWNVFEYCRFATFATMGSLVWPPWVIMLVIPGKIFRMAAYYSPTVGWATTCHRPSWAGFPPLNSGNQWAGFTIINMPQGSPPSDP